MNRAALLLLAWHGAFALAGAPAPLVLSVQNGAPPANPAPESAAPTPPSTPSPQSSPATRKPAAAPAEAIEPPFIAAAGARPQAPRASEGDCPPPYVRGARQWIVEPGTSWRLFADRVLPGDEILFTAWFHIPQDFTGLEGTAERPIFIRSRDSKPAAIACEQHGLAIRRCKHVVVENIMFLNPTEAAIVVDGSPVMDAPEGSPLRESMATGWNSELLIRNCTVAGTRGTPGQDALRVLNTNGVTVDSVRVDGWMDCAVEISDSRRVFVRGLMTVSTPAGAQKRGIAVLGASSDISLTVCSINDSVTVGVQVGTPGVPNENGVPPVPPVERMRMDRCLFDRSGIPVLLANVREFVISRATFMEPRDAVYAIPDDAGVVERVRIENSLGVWQPGGLVAFSPHPARVPASAITLAENLWYSPELPAAWDVLGAPFGYRAAEQSTSVDPLLEPRTLRPIAADAVRFGVYSIATGSGDAAPGAPTAPSVAPPPQDAALPPRDRSTPAPRSAAEAPAPIPARE